MESAKPFLKTIGNTIYHYDPLLDVISEGSPYFTFPFERTQVTATVDLCVEISTWCNLTCANCFSNSRRNIRGSHLPFSKVHRYLESRYSSIIRLSLTGGEPFMHPEIKTFLKLPEELPELVYVVTTNGTLREDLDHILIHNNWLTAVSLHGYGNTHDLYVGWKCFDSVQKRIERLAPSSRVHIYSVLHDGLSETDVDWLFRFRDESGTQFLRFITPRPFGRYRMLSDNTIMEYVKARLDKRSGLKVSPSRTEFITVQEAIRCTM